MKKLSILFTAFILAAFTAVTLQASPVKVSFETTTTVKKFEIIKKGTDKDKCKCDQGEKCTCPEGKCECPTCNQPQHKKETKKKKCCKKGKKKSCCKKKE